MTVHMCEPVSAVQLQFVVPRGVYEAPYYDTTGAVLLVAVTRSHRLLAWSRVKDPADYRRAWAQLEAELDATDPVKLRLEV